ncbi:TPA: hypothetical protein MIP25_25165 [Klebsiella pneumoniae]|nr:hypothetical protein [Klebsiella pneumoniae]HBY0899088.1 hypothetical protein [Klebsiella pneumoniae]
MNSKLTRERLQEIAEDGFLKHGESKELARMALAAMESEPVADDGIFRPGDAVGVFNVGCETCPDHLVAWTVKGQNLPVGNYWLYISPQPAPVVPAVSDDIGEIRVSRLPTMNQDDYPGLGDWWVQLRIGEDSDEVLARVYGATPQEANNRAEALACRAAMLSGGKS